MIIFLYCCLISTIILVISFLVIYSDKIKSHNILQCIIHFEHYITVFNFHMTKAYDIIYKEKILIYSIESTKLDETQFSTVSRDFANLVLKMIGPNLEKSLITLYGDEDTLLFNIMEFFNTKFENDEVYKSATDNLLTESNSSIWETP